MRWARVAVGLGAVLLVAGFCLGVDTRISTTVAGQSYGCRDVIPAGVLVSGQTGAPQEAGPDTRTPAERRLDAGVRAACAPLERHARRLVWSGLGLGALILLGGWTVLREREHEAEPAPLHARSVRR